MMNRSKIYIVFLTTFTGSLIIPSEALWDLIDVVEFAQEKKATQGQETAPTKTPAVKTIKIPVSTFVNQPLSYVQSKITLNTSTPATSNFTELSTSGNYPTSMNINFGKSLAFPFFSNPWQGVTYGSGVIVNGQHISAYLSPYVEKVDWSKGVTFLMLAVDQSIGKNGNVITDLTKAEPESFYMFVYDENKEYLGSAPISVLAAADAVGFDANNPITNNIQLEVNTKLAASATYPAAFTITGPAPIQAAPKVSLTYGNFPSLSLSQLKQQINLNVTSGSIVLPVGSTTPNSLSINFGSAAGFVFYDTQQNDGTLGQPDSHATAAQLPNITATQWAKGVTFVLLAFGGYGSLWPQIKGEPATFILCIYDSTGKLIGTPIQMPLAQASGSSQFSGSWDAGANAMTITGTTSALTAQYPAAFTIKGFAAAPTQTLLANKSYSAVTNTLSAAGINVNSSTPVKAEFMDFAESKNYPESMNINFGMNTGYSFFSDVWQDGTYTHSPIAADLSSLVADVDWSVGVKVLMLAFDASGKVISKITKATPPSSFYVFMFNNDTLGASLGTPVLVPLEGASATFPNYNVWSSQSPVSSNNLQLGINRKLKASATYPAVFQITGPGSSQPSASQPVTAQPVSHALNPSAYHGF